jgi:hypothetical protein
MPVSNWTYVYFTLMTADALCTLLALIKRDEARLEIFAVTTPLMAIGFFSHLYAIQAV